MKGKQWWGTSVILLATLALAGSNGVAPRSSADKYPTHAGENGASIGAARLSSGQIIKAFSLDKAMARDLGENCVVVEVGLYPAKDGALEVAPDGFVLRVRGQDDAIKAATPTAAVAAIPYYVQLGETSGGGGGGIMPGPRVDSPTGVNRDPITGMPRRGVGATPNATDVGVEVGSRESGQPALPPERRDLAAKMSDKALQRGKITEPIAGYVYFSIETKKGEKYQLEYTLEGKRIVLSL